MNLPEDAEPIAFGRDADIYSIDDEWVLRRYRNGHPVRDEADFMRHVARYGYPVPAVRDVDGADMVLQRLDGPTLGDAAIAGDLSATEIGLIHADLHRRLQAIPAPSGTPGRVVVHGDLHPLNVMATADGPVVIDWGNVEEGTAEFDVAMTAIIFAQVALDPAYENLTGPVARWARDVPGELDRPHTRASRRTGAARQQPDPDTRRARPPPRPGSPDPLPPLAHPHPVRPVPARTICALATLCTRSAWRARRRTDLMHKVRYRGAARQAFRNCEGFRARVTMRSSPMWPAKPWSTSLA